jgi:hypothetical protein
MLDVAKQRAGCTRWHIRVPAAQHVRLPYAELACPTGVGGTSNRGWRDVQRQRCLSAGVLTGANLCSIAPSVFGLVVVTPLVVLAHQIACGELDATDRTSLALVVEILTHNLLDTNVNVSLDDESNAAGMTSTGYTVGKW